MEKLKELVTQLSNIVNIQQKQIDLLLAKNEEVRRLRLAISAICCTDG